jgi:hypothetical protein
MLWWPRLFFMGSFLIFLFGAKPYKLHRDDVKAIERETGTQAEDLTEDEIITAMKKLGIKKLELSPDEREVIERS